MKDNQLVMLSRKFAVAIINLCEEIRENKKGNILRGQLLRCGTSIGANIHEANYAASRADFINKMQIALKECYETDYWLDIFCESGIIATETKSSLTEHNGRIRAMLIASINTAKKNAENGLGTVSVTENGF